MPTDEKILGFSNRWYGPALKEATWVELEPGLTIRLVRASHFLATKIEAFRGRGKGDYGSSHDLEDVVSVLDGRPEVVGEIEHAQEDLRAFLAHAFLGFLQDEAFLQSLAGHLPPDVASQARLPLVLERMRAVADMGRELSTSPYENKHLGPILATLQDSSFAPQKKT
jgi:hypothetical protein